jgi:hypothetical protein
MNAFDPESDLLLAPVLQFLGRRSFFRCWISATVSAAGPGDR